MEAGTAEFQKVSPRAVKLWLRQGLVASVFYFAPGIISALVFEFPYVLILSALLSLYSVLIRPRLEYRQWRYRITDKYVDIVHGIFFTTHTHIPIFRIQHLDISQGPLQKGLGLASIVLVTAGLSHKIHAVDWEIAQSLLNEIRNKIYEVSENI